MVVSPLLSQVPPSQVCTHADLVTMFEFQSSATNPSCIDNQGCSSDRYVLLVNHHHLPDLKTSFLGRRKHLLLKISSDGSDVDNEVSSDEEIATPEPNGTYFIIY